jgi:PHP family Zn ribbon phosphoesterase
MNCLRSLEFIKRIDDAYKKFGLRTILVHPPEWSFEKNISNIADAMKKYRINLQIIIDKDKKILKKLKTNFWPAQILIRNGKILYKHIGEGNYKKLEDKIVKLLNIHTK